MSKSRPATQREPGIAPNEGNGPGNLVRIVVSLLLIWHLSAVFLAPLSIQPTSRLVVSLAQGTFMQWYLDLLYINHGYHFFAPDPGPGHLIRYELLDERGGQIETGEFPNRKEQWPRLWYHRHFMLADQVGIPQPTEEESKRWQRRYLENYARNLLRLNENAHAVRVRWVAHYPIPPEHGYQGRKLNDPSTYETLLEVSERRATPPPPTTDQSRVWQESQQIGSRPDLGGWSGGMR